MKVIFTHIILHIILSWLKQTIFIYSTEAKSLVLQALALWLGVIMYVNVSYDFHTMSKVIVWKYRSLLLLETIDIQWLYVSFWIVYHTLFAVVITATTVVAFMRCESSIESGLDFIFTLFSSDQLYIWMAIPVSWGNFKCYSYKLMAKNPNLTSLCIV